MGKKKEKIIIIFIDAFSSRYLNHASFFQELYKKESCVEIDNLPAFEGIGTTVFSGTWPMTNGIWTNFIRRKQPDVAFSTSLLSHFFKFSNWIPNDRLAWDFRYILYRMFKKPVPIPNLIPPNLIKFFELNLNSPIFEDKVLKKISTIFDILRKNDKSFTLITQSIFSNDEKVVTSVIDYIKSKKHANLTYLKFSSLDTFGHIYGPMSMKTMERVRFIDSSVNKIANEASSHNITLLIFSDHGMVPVHHHVNLMKILGKTPIKICEDYLMFLDSTMARFWFNSELARNYVETLLSDLECGVLLSDKDLRKKCLPIDRDKYGEVIFALNEGYVIHPDFFHRNTQVKGMHSYFYSKFDKPIFAVYPPAHIQKNPVQFVDIMPSVLKLLDVPIPKVCEGISVIG